MSDIQNRGEQFIVFQANGEGFKNSIDLYAIERLIPEYRRLLDASYTQITHLPAFKKQARLVSYSTKFQPGCLDVVVDIAVKSAPLVMGVAATDGGGFQIAKMSFQLITKIIQLRKKVKELLDAKKKLPEFRMNMQNATLQGSLLAPIVFNGDNNTITLAPQIYFGAMATHGAVNRLAKAVDGVTVSDVNLQHAGELGESLTMIDRGIADAPMGQLDQTVKLSGKLDSLTISTRKGFLLIGENRYPIDWNENIKDKLKRVVDQDGAVFTARPVMDFTRLTTNPVRFHVVDCDVGQLEL